MVQRRRKGRSPAAAEKRQAAADERKARRLQKAAEKAEAEQHGKSKGRVWKKTDPLKFPAYMFTEDVFKANHPFIQVICGEAHMPAFNKFSTELRTKRSIREAALLELFGFGCRTVNEKKAAEFVLALQKAAAVHDTVRGHTGEDDLSNEEVGDEKLVIVVEEEHKNDENASYQGGHSAVTEIAAKSIMRKQVSHVYVLSLAAKWKYAILQARGLVGVKNGAIDPASLPEFREQERAMGFANDPIPDAELHNMLKTGTKYYQERYSDCPTAVYPDGFYPVGKYYVSDVWRMLPQDAVGGCNTDDVHLFYEGMLRILIGDRVINWGDEEMDKVRKVRKLFKEENIKLKTMRY